jgi:transcriptional regulator with PAS, ATPase and Fis domain
MVETPEDWKWSSYLATAGKTKPHPSLTTDWVLGQFSRKRGKAEQEYRQFVNWGIGQKTIWTEVRGQSLLGEDAFMEKLTDYLKKHKDIPEIPRSQRYATRPKLAVLLPDGIEQDQKKLKRRLSEAVEKHGYRQSELARHLGVHYSTISRWLREHENARRKT